MMKPFLLYLHKDETSPPLAVWPELDRIETANSRETYLQNFCMGGPFDIGPVVVSMEAGDDDALRYVDECVTGVHVIAVRGTTSDEAWTHRLNSTCARKYTIGTTFERHDVAVALGRKAYWDGIELLQIAVDYLRGPGVQASPDAMRTESTLTKAIESLCTSGYRTLKR